MRVLAVICLVALALGLNDHDRERQAFVDEINNTPGIGWKAGLYPRFAGKPLDHAKSMCGVNIEKSKMLLKRAVEEGTVLKGSDEVTVDLPESFDSETNWPMCAKVIGDIRDQSNCGCCWAFGAAEAASDRMCIATNASIMLPLSSQDMCFCASFNGCGGGELEPAWRFIHTHGLVTGGQVNNSGPFANMGLCSAFSLPHCHHHGPVGHGGDPYPAEGAKGCPDVTRSPSCPRRCDSAARAPHNSFNSDKYTFKGQTMHYSDSADAIAQAIMEHGPVEGAFTVYADFANYVSGVYHHVSGGILGGHAIRVVGWGVDESGMKYWKVANSWNPYWGEQGYFRIRRGTNECGLEEQIVASSPGASWGKMNDMRA